MEHTIVYVFWLYTIGVLAEYILRVVNGKPHELRHALLNISIGVGFAVASGIAQIYAAQVLAAAKSIAIFDLPRGWSALFRGESAPLWIFPLLIVVDDFCYYVFHRISHRTKIFWSAHETHHSSPTFNYTTGLRNTWTGPFIHWIFWLPMALLGFDLEDIAIQTVLNTAFQFLVHTEQIRSFGILDKIFNSPSHHRVHHGSNPQYIDKNFGGILIVWDRLFGTFEPEKEQAIYGVKDPVHSWNPAYMALRMSGKLIMETAEQKGVGYKLRYLFMPPEWMPEQCCQRKPYVTPLRTD